MISQMTRITEPRRMIASTFLFLTALRGIAGGERHEQGCLRGHGPGPAGTGPARAGACGSELHQVPSDSHINYPAGVIETPPPELHDSRKLISPGPEMRPALFRCEVAVIVMSDELFP